MPDKKLKSQKKLKREDKKIVTKAKIVKVSKVIAKKKTKPSAKLNSEKKETGGLKIDVYDLKGKVVEKMNLPKEIFGQAVNKILMAQAVRVYLANQRRGTVKTKSRGEVNISTRKIWRQKGTGRARHGAASAPIFVGGGIAFGPKQRDFSLSFPKKMKKKSLFSALSVKLKDKEIKVLSGLEKIEPKTKKMADVFKKLELNGQKVLLVIPEPKTENVYKAARNLKGVRIVSANLLNTYEVLNSKHIVLMKTSVDSLKNNFLKEKN